MGNRRHLFRNQRAGYRDGGVECVRLCFRPWQRRSFIAGAGGALASPFLSPFSAFSQALVDRSAKHRLPITDSHYQGVRSYIEEEPVQEYRSEEHTSEL